MGVALWAAVTLLWTRADRAHPLPPPPPQCSSTLPRSTSRSSASRRPRARRPRRRRKARQRRPPASSVAPRRASNWTSPNRYICREATRRTTRAMHASSPSTPLPFPLRCARVCCSRLTTHHVHCTGRPVARSKEEEQAGPLQSCLVARCLCPHTKFGCEGAAGHSEWHL